MIKNQNVLMRLTQYKKALIRLKVLGFKKVFADNLAEAADVKPTLVRKDFSTLKIMGQKRGGYYIAELLEKIEKLIGKSKEEKVILVGLGHLGTALLNYKGFERENIKIVAAFDIKPDQLLASQPIPVLSMEQLPEFVASNKIKTSIMAVPIGAAQQTLDILLSVGITGILNFAGMQLKSTDHCIIKNVDLALEIEQLIYQARTFKATSKNAAK